MINIIALHELVEFTSGKNPTRLKGELSNVYNQEDFENDLNCLNSGEERAECIINLIKTKAAPVTTQTRNKTITINFLRCKFDPNVLDQWYFCYQFNEDKRVEQQISMSIQGTTVSVKRLNVKMIGDLEIDLPDIEKQRVIGSIYRQSLIENHLMQKKAEGIRNLTMSIIKKIQED